jgi:hypothetical protein
LQAIPLTIAYLHLSQKVRSMTLLGCVSKVKERTVTELIDVNTASLENDIKQLIAKQFGLDKSKLPETRASIENIAPEAAPAPA